MKKPIYLFVLLLVAEVAASAAVWHGTPTDWTSGPLRFWVYEGIRLRYWASFCLFFSVVLWGVGRMGLRRLFSVPPIQNLLLVICSLGIEVLTSVCFSKRLSQNQVGYLGWTDLRRYALEHLLSWTVVLLSGLAVLHIWSKRKHNEAA